MPRAVSGVARGGGGGGGGHIIMSPCAAGRYVHLGLGTRLTPSFCLLYQSV